MGHSRPEFYLFEQVLRQSLSRRALLLSSVASGSLYRAYGQAPAIITSKNKVPEHACTLTPEETQGPYYLDGTMVRRDITEARPGVRLQLQIRILDATGCQPIRNAAVNIWHCDAGGRYSGFTANSMGGGRPPGGRGHRPFGMPSGDGWDPPSGRPPGPPPDEAGEHPHWGPPPPFLHHGATDNMRYLRGIQLTDANGIAQFDTIYPGWYFGRAIHIHLKVHVGGSADASYTGGHVCHTGQLFLPEEISDSIVVLGPYASHSGERTRQDEDFIFHSHGTGLILSLQQNDKRKRENGFLATAVVGVDPRAVPREMGPGGPPGGPFRRGPSS